MSIDTMGLEAARKWGHLAGNRLPSWLGKSAAIGLGLSVMGIGFTKGLDKSGATSAFLGAVTGDPNLDQDILGTKIKPSQLFIPNPFLHIAQHGIPGARSGIPRLMGLVGGGFVNERSIMGGLTRANQPFSSDIPVTSISTSSPSYSSGNTPPQASGDMVFGMYNARYGR